MIEKSDWRLMGQEGYLKGATLVHRRYLRRSADCDHHHCEFCMVKFMAANYPEVLHQGYTTPDGCCWICERCFEDFREMFEWQLMPDEVTPAEAADAKAYDHLKSAPCLNLAAPDTMTTATLCIHARDLNIGDLTSLLGIEPTSAHVRGDKVKPGSPPASEGTWLLEAPGNLTLAEKLSYLLETTTADQAVWDDLAASHRLRLNCAVFLHTWTDGFEVPAAVMEQIGRRHWGFGISAYSAEGEEIARAFLKKPDSRARE